MIEVHPEALTHWRRERGRAIRRTLAPRPRLSVSQWADARRILSREASAEPGQWSTERTPYLREIMDCFSNPSVEQVVFMKSARIGGTECGNNVIGYFIDQDPCSMLAILPTVDMAKGWSKEQLAPLVRDSPCLRDRVKDPSSRDSGNTIQQKTYPGGILTILGANSGAGFRMRTVRVFYGSEVDAWPDSAGSEGDPVMLGIKRTETFANRKIYLESTPLLKDLSRIERAYHEGDQRQYHVPCPYCQHFQILKWKEGLKYEGLDQPMYACEGCGALIPEEEKYDMVAKGKWVASAPFTGTASFRINALYSPFDGARWPKLVKQWQECQGDNMRLQSFVNTVLGESWEIRGGKIDPVGLQGRVEKYATEVPQGACVLTAGVDVQADRLELQVIGWGPGMESWRVLYKVIEGDPSHPEPWKRLDEELFREYAHPSGPMKIRATCVDTGFHASESVYKYVKPRQHLRVIATKGSSTDTAPLLPRRPTINNKGRVRLYVIGTNAAKAIIYGRLKIDPPEPGTPGPHPQLCHFPDWCDAEYFAQLTAEKAIRSQINGKWVFKYVLPPGKRNEVLDTEVLSLVAFELCGIPANRLESMAKALEPAMSPVEAAANPAEPVSILPQLRQNRMGPKRNWVNKW